MTSLRERSPWRGALAVLLLVGCAGSTVTEKARSGLSLAFQLTNGVATASARWDRSEGLAIADRAKTRAEGEAALVAHHAIMAKLDKAIVTSYTAIGAAATALTLVEAGKGDPVKLLGLLGTVAQASEAIREAYAEVSK